MTIHHIPKGSMCANCTRCHTDCSALPFHLMPSLTQIEQDGETTIIVRCTWYERQREDETV